MVCRHLQLCGNFSIPTRSISALQGENQNDKIIRKCILDTEINLVLQFCNSAPRGDHYGSSRTARKTSIHMSEPAPVVDTGYTMVGTPHLEWLALSASCRDSKQKLLTTRIRFCSLGTLKHKGTCVPNNDTNLINSPVSPSSVHIPHSNFQSISALGNLMATAKGSSIAISRNYAIATSLVGRDYVQS
ncbi:hypothetical protein CR513_39672, partial [Mucuna pruriens]